VRNSELTSAIDSFSSESAVFVVSPYSNRYVNRTPNVSGGAMFVWNERTFAPLIVWLKRGEERTRVSI
jgi:hypothetical protein